MSKIENALPKPKIELYSGKYFAACAVGGVIGISPSSPPSFPLPSSLQADPSPPSLRPNPHSSNAPGPRKNTPTSRLQTL